MIHVKMTDGAGVILSTSGKYCKEDVFVSPVLQAKMINVAKNGSVDITPDEGNCALSSVTVQVDIPLHDTYSNAEGVKF